MATATPAILPVPTRDASEVHSAAKGEMPAWSVSDDPMTQRIISGK